MTHPRRDTNGPALTLVELVALCYLASSTTHEDAARAMAYSSRTYRRLLSQATVKLHATGPTHAACLAVSVQLLVPNADRTGFCLNPKIFASPQRNPLAQVT